MLGRSNRLGIDREHGFKVTAAAAHDGAQPEAVLDPADTAYRSAANVEMLTRRGLKPQCGGQKTGCRRMPRHIARGNAARA